MPSRTRSTPTYPRKRHRGDDDGWHSYDEDEDRNNDVEEWEAQAVRAPPPLGLRAARPSHLAARCCAQDGTFEKLVKPVPAEAASDQLVNLQLDRDTDSVMDEEEDEGEEDEPVAEEEPEQGEGEEPGADEEEGEAAEHSEGAVPQKDTDARQRVESLASCRSPAGHLLSPASLWTQRSTARHPPPRLRSPQERPYKRPKMDEEEDL